MLALINHQDVGVYPTVGISNILGQLTLGQFQRFLRCNYILLCLAPTCTDGAAAIERDADTQCQRAAVECAAADLDTLADDRGRYVVAILSGDIHGWQVI